MSIDRPLETGEGMLATDTGTVSAAGGSARAEFDRRSAQHHERARRRRPFLEIRGSEVYVAGRRRTAMLDEVRREVAAVEAALGPEFAALGIRAEPLICVHRAELPLFRSEADGIPIVSAKGMVKRLRAARTTLDVDVIGRITSIADARLHPAGPRERVG